MKTQEFNDSINQEIAATVRRCQHDYELQQADIARGEAAIGTPRAQANMRYTDLLVRQIREQRGEL